MQEWSCAKENNTRCQQRRIYSYCQTQCIGAALEALPGSTIAHVPVLPLLCVLPKQPPEHREAAGSHCCSQVLKPLGFCFASSQPFPLCFHSFLSYFMSSKKQTKKIFPTLTYSFIVSIICNTLNHLSSWKGWGRCINVILGIIRHLQ